MAQWWEALELQRLPAAESPGGPGSSLPASMLGLKLCYDVAQEFQMIRCFGFCIDHGLDQLFALDQIVCA